MTKNLKITFILYAIVTAIAVSWKTLFAFFGGAGLSLVALLTIIAIIIGLSVSDNYVYKRTKDLMYITAVFAVFEFIVYFGLDFAVKSVSHIPAFLIFQNVISVLAILNFAYIAFRFITEYKGIKITFIEVILGNEKISKKQKKAKELTNGTLEEKPKSMKEDEVNSTEENKENIIVSSSETFEPENKDEE